MIRLCLILLLLPVTTAAQQLTPAGRVVVESDFEGFGGLSGIEVFPNGEFISVSDRGNFFLGEINRVDGIIQSVMLRPPLPILDSKGSPLDKRNTDAEDLTIGPDGEMYISFESNNRVMRHDELDVAATFLPKHEDFRAFGYNSGMEALAINYEGELLAIPERSGKETRPFPVYTFDGTEWSQTTSISRTDGFLVVGADFGPKNRLYILERAFGWREGFSTRVRRFDYIEREITNEETLLTSRSDKLDNMEGISVWRDNEGRIRMTLVSDDNFNPLQRTVIAEYLIND